MYVIGSVVLAVLLIVLIKTGKLKLHKTSAAIAAMLMTAASAGLYFAEGARIPGALSAKLFGTNIKEIADVKMYGDTSKAAIVAKIILMIVCAVPVAAGIIYSVQALVRRAAVREGYEADNVFNSRRAKASAAHGISASVLMIIMTALMVMLAYPHIDDLMKSMILVNPVILLIFSLLTFGIAIIPLTGYFLAINGVLFMIVSGLGAAAVVLYILSVLFGISSAAGAAKSGAVSKGKSTIYGLLSLLAGWNILVFISLKKEISKNAVQ